METRPGRRLTYGERWLHDGLLVCAPPAFHESIEVDVSHLKEMLAAAREDGFRLTYTHILVRAAALALAANPSLNSALAGNRIHYPSGVDIALSIGAETPVAPLLVLEGVDRKPLPVIAEEIARRMDEARESHRKLLSRLDAWGWMLPFSFLRRAFLRLSFRSFGFRRKGAGTFQVSIVPGVDQCATAHFSTTAILVAGEVKNRVIAVNGQPAVRPTVFLTCSADHRVWNGHHCQIFLQAVCDVLAGSQLEKECCIYALRRY